MLFKTGVTASENTAQIMPAKRNRKIITFSKAHAQKEMLF